MGCDLNWPLAKWREICISSTSLLALITGGILIFIEKFKPLPGFEPGTSPVASLRANHELDDMRSKLYPYELKFLADVGLIFKIAIAIMIRRSNLNKKCVVLFVSLSLSLSKVPNSCNPLFYLSFCLFLFKQNIHKICHPKINIYWPPHPCVTICCKKR